MVGFVFQSKHINTRKGSSILMIVMMLGFLVLLLSGSLSILDSIRREQRNVPRKIELRAMQALTNNIFSQTSDCDCQVSGFNFDEAKPIVSLPRILSSCVPSAEKLISTDEKDNPRFLVDSLSLQKITPTVNSNEYSGEIIIGQPKNSASDSQSFLKLRHDVIPILFHTDPDSPTGKKIITGCGTAPLTGPKNLTAAAGNKTGTCNFNWIESTGAKPIIYTVRGSLVEGGSASGTLTCIGSNVTNCEITGLTSGQKYYFSIVASNISQGESLQSKEVSCIPLEEASKPIIAVEQESLACNVSFSASTGEKPIRYTIYKSETPGVTKASPIVCKDITSLSCAATALTPNKRYYFAASANNILGASDLSNEVECIPYTNLTGVVSSTTTSELSCDGDFKPQPTPSRIMQIETNWVNGVMQITDLNKPTNIKVVYFPSIMTSTQMKQICSKPWTVDYNMQADPSFTSSPYFNETPSCKNAFQGKAIFAEPCTKSDIGGATVKFKLNPPK